MAIVDADYMFTWCNTGAAGSATDAGVFAGYFSLILLEIVDADYRFIWCNTGTAGSASDAGVFNGS